MDAGAHRFEARLLLAQEHANNNVHAAARQNAEDLLEILQKGKAEVKLVTECAWIIANSFQAGIDKVDRRVEALRAFLEQHPSEARAPQASRNIAEIFQSAGRMDDAIAAYRDFIAAKNYQFVSTDASAKPDPKSGVSPAQQLENWQREAQFAVGQLLFGQKKYDDAIAEWQAYVGRYPNGAQCTASQSGIIHAEFQMGLDAVAADKETAARERFDAFLQKYPLDPRARQIMFMLGQIHFSKAEEIERSAKEKTASPQISYGGVGTNITANFCGRFIDSPPLFPL